MFTTLFVVVLRYDPRELDVALFVVIYRYDPRELDVVLREVVVMNARAELYLQFIEKRITVRAFLHLTFVQNYVSCHSY